MCSRTSHAAYGDKVGSLGNAQHCPLPPCAACAVGAPGARACAMMAMSAACRMKQLLPPMFGPVTTSARGPPSGRPPPSPWPASPALLVAPLASGASGQRPPPPAPSSAPGGRAPGCCAGSAPPRRQQSLGTMGASVASASSTGCRPAAITSCCGSCSSTNSGRTYLRRGRQAARHWQGAQVPSRGPRLPSQVVRDPAPQQHPQQHHPRLVQPPLAQSAALHVPQQQHPAAATASRVAPCAVGGCAICGCCCYGCCCSCCACSDCCCGFCPSLAARQQRRRHRTSPPSRAPRAPPPPSCRTRPAAPVWHAVTQADAAPANFYFFSRTAPAWKALIQDLGLSATTPGWQQSWQQQCSGRHGTGAWHPGVQQNLGSACARARTSRRSLYWLSGVAISSSLGAANISRPSSSERIRPSLPRSARAGVARGHAPKTERCGSERLTAWGLVGQAPQ